MKNKAGEAIFALTEKLLPWIVLAVVVFFTYVKFFAVPYIGFRWDPSGQVTFVYDTVNTVSPLQFGDQLQKADAVSWADYKQNLRQPFIGNILAGQVIQLQVKRNGQEINIPWVIPGPNWGEISNRIWSEGWTALLFWFMGILTFLNIRPKNEHWKLLVAFNFLTALWLTVGSGLSHLHVWQSAILLRSFVWMSVPVYLHLHWVFPKPIANIPKSIIWSAYLLSALLAVMQWFEMIPQSLYYLGFLFSIIGSIILLVIHIIRQPETRSDIRILFLVAAFSFMPIFIIGVLDAFFDLFDGFNGLGLLTLPLFPIAYFYTIFRRQLGGLEVRFNQLLSAYIFAILLMAVFVPLMLLMNEWVTGLGAGVLIGVVILLLTVFATLTVYHRVQAIVERSILGVSFSSRDLLELYSERITTSTSITVLQNILENEILPRLHVRQFAFLQIGEVSPHLLFSFGIQDINLHLQTALEFSSRSSGKYRPPESSFTHDTFAWVRLSIELKIENQLTGVWLFGRCDPDDFYSQYEIDLIQSLAHQTAVALSNIIQTQRVLEMYQQNISQHENERIRLALDLHDSILNSLASLYLSLDDNAISPKFQSAYENLTGQLREIISNMRPPMLSYGLGPALDELIEGLAERHKEEVQFTLDVQPNENRYPAEVEQHLFRIVQEACENSLRHGQARSVKLTGCLSKDEIVLAITDDGNGFDAKDGFELAGLLANKHFGLAGMLERAKMIGGEIKIDSQPSAGTRIDFHWKLPKS